MKPTNQVVASVTLMYFFTASLIASAFIFHWAFGIVVLSALGASLSAYWATRASEKIIDLGEHPKVKEWLKN